MLFQRAAMVVSSVVLVLNGPAHAVVNVEPATVEPQHAAELERFGAALKQSQEDRWWAWAAVQEWNLAVARNEQARTEAAARRPPAPRRAAASVPSGDQGGRHYLCPEYASGDNPTGDFAVPCYIIGRESHGSYTADNPNSSAYGAYQILRLPPGTPPAEQDRVARGMALCNWSPPNYCAGG